MSKFNYVTDSVVGVLVIDQQGNGHVSVYGYIHERSFVSLNPKVCKEEFKPKGEVFALKAADKNYNLAGRCVKLEVIPNQNETDSRRDAFMWNNRTTMDQCGQEVKQIKETLDGDGQENHEVLMKNNLLESNSPIFALANGHFYYLEERNGSKVIPYCNMDDVNLICYKDSNKWFFVDDSIPIAEGYIDIMGDQALVDWFVQKVLNSGMWKNFKDGKKQDVMLATKEAMGSLKLRGNVMESRIKRLDNFTETFTLTLDTVKSLAGKPWFGDSVKATLDQHKKELCNELIENDNEVVQARKEAQLKEIAKKREQANEELKEVRQALVSDRKELRRVTEDLENKRCLAEEVMQKLAQIGVLNHDSIMVLQNVVKALNSPGDTVRDVYHLEHIDLKVKNMVDIIPVDEILLSNLLPCLRKLQASKYPADEIAALLKSYKVLLLPDVHILMAVLYAMGRSSYLTVYVGVAWKSFADLWMCGLDYIIGKCNEEPERMHFLVLRNINLSCIPNYLQPVFDIQSGLISTFPGTDITFPDNLRLLATASADTLIPMTDDALRQMGCAPKNKEAAIMPVDGLSGVELINYVTPDILKRTSTKTALTNHYKDYVNE